MDTGKFAMELAEQRVDQERDASVARVRASLSVVGSGATHCACGEDIPPARRKALPHTRQCVDCARATEAGKR